MAKFGSILLAAVLSTSFWGCASLKTVSITQIPAERSRPVSAEVSRTYFLGFKFSNDFVDSLQNDLKSKCRGGQIKGIFTKHDTVSYIIVTTETVRASGFCQKG